MRCNSLKNHKISIMIEIVLGFDFGMKYIGIATGDLLTKTATPHTTILAKNGIPNWEIIGKIVKEWIPDMLIVGLPLNMNGSEQLITKHANKFANRLRIKYKLNVQMIDETLTTWEARNIVSSKNNFNKINAISAAIILEDWLRVN